MHGRARRPSTFAATSRPSAGMYSDASKHASRTHRRSAPRRPATTSGSIARWWQRTSVPRLPVSPLTDDAALYVWFSGDDGGGDDGKTMSEVGENRERAAARH